MSPLDKDSMPPEKNPAIFRGDGITPAERYLKRLCERTFLSLWSHAGIFRKEEKQGKIICKEVCDLLVMFGNDIIIFSDKYCEVPNTGDIRLDWKRWFRKGALKSSKQAWGAERYIRSSPERLFSDPRCTHPFPFKLPSMEDARFHLVVVAHDISRRCAKDLGGSGSLMIQSELVGASSHIVPFTIGDLDPRRSFVHMFDDTSLKILMESLDTIFDFLSYLNKKERFLRSGRPIFAAGEEELLAVYLKNQNSKGEHDFIFPGLGDTDVVLFEEGIWEAFQKDPQRLAQIELNKGSYIWDNLIEQFCRHTIAGDQYHSEPSGAEYTEQILRFMAGEPRLHRRAFGRQLWRILEETPANKARRTIASH